MLVTPLPGTSRKHVHDTLRGLHNAAYNLRGGGLPSPAQNRITQYIEWTTNAAQQLSRQVSAADINRLIMTSGFERLYGSVGTMTGLDVGTQRILNGLLSHELSQRLDDLESAVQALAGQIAHWNRPGQFVVADTSVYIEHPEKLEVLDFRPVLGIRGDPVNLLVPIIVVDELDGLKKSRDPQVRWRACYTLAVLDRVFANSTGPVVLSAADFSMLATPGGIPSGIPRGEVTVELFFDPPGHVRLPINDDEIIDRTLAIQSLSEREVTLVTYDTGMSTRARSAALSVRKQSRPQEEEPVAGQNGRPRQTLRKAGDTTPSRTLPSGS